MNEHDATETTPDCLLKAPQFWKDLMRWADEQDKLDEAIVQKAIDVINSKYKDKIESITCNNTISKELQIQYKNGNTETITADDILKGVKCKNMTEHDATETAYKNGYARAKEDIIEKLDKEIEKTREEEEAYYDKGMRLIYSIVRRKLKELKKEISDG